MEMAGTISFLIRETITTATPKIMHMILSLQGSGGISNITDMTIDLGIQTSNAGYSTWDYGEKLYYSIKAQNVGDTDGDGQEEFSVSDPLDSTNGVDAGAVGIFGACY